MDLMLTSTLVAASIHLYPAKAPIVTQEGLI